jgi:Cu2+-containing amine oxidase
MSEAEVFPYHPLVPLTRYETSAVGADIRAIILAKFGINISGSDTTVPVAVRPAISQIQLQEADKNYIYAFNAGRTTTIIRRAVASVYFPSDSTTAIYVYNITYAPGSFTPIVQLLDETYGHQIIPAMDQYIYTPFTQWPVSNATMPAGVNFKSVAQTIVDGDNQVPKDPLAVKILDELVCRLSGSGTPAEKRAILKGWLTTGLMLPDYLGGFEGARNQFNECNKNIVELVGTDEPRHRYSPFFFRFFPPQAMVLDARAKNTAVYNLPGTQLPPAGVNPDLFGAGAAYYDSLNRLEGILVLADLTDRKLIRMSVFSTCDEKIPSDAALDKIQRPFHGWNTSVKPMNISLPEGRSFTYENGTEGTHNTGLVKFDNWSFRLSFDYTAGVQLYNVTYADTDIVSGGKVDRTVLYKASITDTTVVYNVGNPLFRRNFTSSDANSYPVGRRLIPLIRGKHVPAHAKLSTVYLNDRDGTAGNVNVNVTLVDAVGIFERDGDVLTAYTNTTGSAFTGPTLRGRELVVRTVFQGLFYLWTFDYIFCQDGTIKCEVQVSGRVAVAYRAGNPDSIYGYYIEKNYFGLAHQHIYLYRFDTDIDVDPFGARGNANNVEMEEAVPFNTTCECSINGFNRDSKCEPEGKKKPEWQNCGCEKKKCHKHISDKHISDKHAGKHGSKLVPKQDLTNLNPAGTAVKLLSTHLETELQAVSDVNPATNRSWVVHNENSKNRLGYARGYEISPQKNGGNVLQDFSSTIVHSGFIKHNFYATPYKVDEQYGNGNYPILQDKDVGLGSWIKQDRSIVNTDVVVWYGINFAHPTHVEDFPTITYASQSVHLVPHNFFEWNQASTISNEQGSINAVNYVWQTPAHEALVPQV